MGAKGKSEYWLTDDGLLLLSAWARDGLTDEQIASNMDISVATLYRYKNEFCDICNALKKGKEVADIEVENALNKKALGFKETVRKPMKLKTVYYNNGKREKEEETVQMVEEEIYIPPDVTAQIFWIKNRKPKQWRDRREVETFANGKDDNKLFEAIEQSALEVWDNVQAVQQQTDANNDMVDASGSE